MTSEIRDMIVDELNDDFSPEQLKKIDLAVAKALQGYTFTREETLPANAGDAYPLDVREFIARKKMKGCSEGTIVQYELVLRSFIGWAKKDLREMTDLDIVVYLDYLQSRRGISNHTLDGHRRILSSFYTFLHDSGKISQNPMKSVDPIKYQYKVREPLTDMEMEQIRDACRDKKDRAVIEVLYSTGARISEIVGLNRADIDYANRRAIVTGKGNKQRYVFFNAKAIYALQQYLDTRDDDNEALFVICREPYNRMTKSGMEAIVRKIGERAGLSRPLFPHLFRHTFATDMLEHGAPIEEMSKILGHERIETTEIYAKSTTAMLAAEHKRCIA